MICCQHLPFPTNPHSCTLLSPFSLAVSYSSTIFSSIPPPAKLARVVIAHSHKLSVNNRFTDRLAPWVHHFPIQIDYWMPSCSSV
ncbi:hypothetical protein M405DRAFT_824881, partial [Rhizopogon salebrosus TDB-379]